MPPTRYHCEACGWDGDTPATHHEPIFHRDQTQLWTMRVCPECGEEVYQTVILNPLDDQGTPT